MKWIDSLKDHVAKRRRVGAPFFVAVPKRELTPGERSVVQRLLQSLPTGYQNQLDGLHVVGQCGCGECPTVFFQIHQRDEDESELVTAQGQDNHGGLVAAVLLEKRGALSQLEFYSVDGHNPWSAPDAATLRS